MFEVASPNTMLWKCRFPIFWTNYAAFIFHHMCDNKCAKADICSHERIKQVERTAVRAELLDQRNKSTGSSIISSEKVTKHSNLEYKLKKCINYIQCIFEKNPNYSHSKKVLGLIQAGEVFARSPCLCASCLWVPWLPHTVQKHGELVTLLCSLVWMWALRVAGESMWPRDELATCPGWAMPLVSWDGLSINGYSKRMPGGTGGSNPPRHLNEIPSPWQYSILFMCLL